MKQRLIAFITVMAMLAANMFSVAADSTTASELIGALPEASEITASTKELRSQIEDINEAIIENGLTESDFSESVWKKWQSVSAKNAYFLPKYETIDISSAAKSVVFANVGETLTNESDFRMNITTWNWYYAFNKETMTKTIGADELLYSDDGIPYSFPQDYRKAIGQDTQGLVDIVLPINEPKVYRSIAMAMTAVGSNPEAAIRFHYTDGSMEEQRVTVNSCYATDGTLTAASADWPMIQASGGNALDVAYAKLGMNSIEFPTDINRKLSKIEIIDYEDPDKTLADGSVDYSPRDSNFRILAITGCTDISDAEKDNRESENIYETINLDKYSNSIAYADSSNLDKSLMNLSSLDFFDWSQTGAENFFAIYKDNMVEIVGDDEKIESRKGVPYFFSKASSKAVAIKKGIADNVGININKKIYEINFLAATGRWEGHGNAEGTLRITYDDGTYSDNDFVVYDSWGRGQSNLENLAVAPKVVYGNMVMTTDDTPVANRMGIFETTIVTETDKKVKKIEFKSVNDTSNYKIMAVTLLSEPTEADGRKFETVNLSYPSNSVVFAENRPQSKTILGKTDWFYNEAKGKYAVISKSDINNIAGEDEIIYSGNGVPFSFPSENLKAIGLLRGEVNAVYADVPCKEYSKVHFVVGSSKTHTDSECYVDLLYTDETSETVNFSCNSGFDDTDGTAEVLAKPNIFEGKESFDESQNGFSMFVINVSADSKKELKGIRFGVSGEGSEYKVFALTGEYNGDAESTNGEETYINLSNIFDSAITVNADDGLDRKNMALNENDFFMYGNYKNCIAVDAEEMSEYVKKGIVTDKNGTSYATDLTKAITVKNAEKTIMINSLYAEDISFVAASGSGADGKVEITFDDGSVKTESFTVTQGYKPTEANREREDWLCEIKKYISFGPTNGYTYNKGLPTMGFYSIHIKNNDMKKISTLKFIGTDKEYKIMALTMKKFSAERFKALTEKAIADIMLSTDTSAENSAAYENVDMLIEILEKYGIDINTISGIEKYKEISAERKKTYTLYISPNGNDDAAGTEPTAPLATLSGVKAKINVFRKNISPNYPITVILQKGEYKEPFNFSGEWGTKTSPVTFDGSEGAVFTGAEIVDVSKATEITDSEMLERIPKKVQSNVIEIDLEEQGINIEQLNAKQFDLFLNGKRQNIAQYPNGTENYAYSSRVVNAAQKGSFAVNDENVANWGKVKENEAYLGGYFTFEYRYDNSLMAPVDTKSKILTLTENTTYGVGGGNGWGSECFRWKAFNVAEELDEPGEWYINKETSKLYYYPPKDLKGCILETVTSADTMIKFEDADYITLKNICFKNSAGTAVQAERNLMEYKSPSNISIESCLFRGVQNGVSMSLGVDPAYYWKTFEGGDNITIKNNAFVSLGANAIYLYGGDTYNFRPNYSVISDNYIYSCGEKERTAYTVNLDYTVGTVFRNNTIHRQPAAAIGYTAYDADILYNEIYDVLRENEDGGALYSGKTFVARGNEIAFNVIRDGLTEKGTLHNTSNTGIYLDDGLSGQNVHHNIIENFGCAFILSGVDNKIYNNTILNSASISIMAKNSEDNMAGEMRNAVIELHNSKQWTTWVKHFPELEEIYANSSQCKRNVIADNLVDRSLYLMTPFLRPGNNTISNNIDYGFRNNAIFDENGLLKKDKGAEYTVGNSSLLTNENFDITQVGIQSKTPSECIGEDFALIYPKNGTRTDNPDRQLFIWESSVGADEYILEISETADFKSIVYSKRVNVNRTEVSDFDFDDKEYFWRVRAENISGSLHKSWMCENMFRIARTGAVQTENMIKQFDISSYFNAQVMIKENQPTKATNDNRLYDPYTMNETFLRKYIDNDGNAEIGGTTFKFDLSGEKKAVNNYSSPVTIELENDRWSSLDFLVFCRAGSADIQLIYEGGTAENKTLNFDTDCMGRMYVQAVYLDTGIVQDHDCQIRAVRVAADASKKLDKIVINAVGKLEGAANIFAVNGNKDKSLLSEKGKTVELYTKNVSNNSKMFDIYEITYDEKGRLERAEKVTEIFNSNETKSSDVFIPNGKTVRRFIWNDKLSPESTDWLSE